MLSLIIFLPIIGSLFFFGIENENQSASNSTIIKRNSIIKQIGLATSLITLLLTLILFSQINNNIGGYQFTETTIPFGFLGIDLNYIEFNYINDNIKSTALVVWGTNLGSALGWYKRSMIKIVRYMYSTLPFYYFSVVIGLILSDGHLENLNSNKVNSRLIFIQSLAKFEYFWSVYCILAPYISTALIFSIKQRSINYNYSLTFRTMSLPCFTFLRLLFYPLGIKTLPLDLFHWMNPIVLAHWICGDGSNVKSGLLLCTDSYSIKDTIFLMNILIIKFDLDCTLRENNPGQYRIYIKKNSMDKVRSLVLPYMVKSMLYKIHL